MTETPGPVQLVCPVCGSDRIIDWEQATVGYRGVRFFQNPDDPAGDVIVDYDGVYDTEHADGGDGGFEDDLMCGDCSTTLASKDLVPEGTEPNPDWERAPAEPTPYAKTGADTSEFAFTFTDEYGAVYTPWTDGHGVGFKVTRDGKVRYLSISPSIGTDSQEDDTTVAFIREGETPQTDEAYAHFDLFGSKVNPAEVGTRSTPAEPAKPSMAHVVAQLRTDDANELLRLAAAWTAAAESDSNDAEHDAGYDLVETLEPFARRVIELLAPMIPTEEDT